jgi:recombination protein RecA
MKAKKSSKKVLPEGGSEALGDALAAIERNYGKGSIMRMGQQTDTSITGISTGSVGLDIAIGAGGVPHGRIVEVYGPESSGKTTLTLHMVAAAQAAGGVAAFIDAEHALDPAYAKKLGVDLDSLLISQPDNGEQALDIAETLVRSGALDIIVIDSVAALVPRAEIEGDMGDSFVGLHARLMSQALRKLTGLMAKTNTCVVFINQIREKIGVMFGSPETTTGGRALKFYSSVRLDIRRIGRIKDGDEVTGNRTKVTTVKNKVAPPFRIVEFDIVFNKGINQIGELLDMGVEKGILRRSGTWISYGDVRLGQGRERSREFLEQNPTICQELKNEVLRAYGAADDPADAGEAPAPEAAVESAKKGSELPEAAPPRAKSTKKSARK